MIEIRNALPWEKTVLVIKVHRISYIILCLHVLATIFITGIFISLFWINIIIMAFLNILWMVSAIILYIQWLNFELDIFIITNHRIIWMDQVGFLNRTVSECNLSQVQEVNSKTKWFFSNIFNYWDLAIQTAWNVTRLTMTLCPDAIIQARKILNIIEAFKAHQAKKILEENAKYQNASNL